MNELVKVKNEMNTIQFKDFTTKDYDYMMAICSRLRDLGEEQVTFDYDYLAELTDFEKVRGFSALVKDLDQMHQKLLRVNFTRETEDKIKSFTLFPAFEIDKHERTVTAAVSPDFKYLLNDFFGGQFTEFELREYIKIKNKYAKVIYQHLKQWRFEGKWMVSVEDFKRLLDVPDSYETKHITNKVINPAVKILRECKGYADLEATPVRSDRRGRALKGYQFTFTPEEKEDKVIVEKNDSPVGANARHKYKKKETNNFNNFQQSDYAEKMGGWKKIEEALVKH